MKKYPLAFALFAAFLVLGACNSGSYSRYPMIHLGTWSGTDSTNMKGVVTFKEDGTGTMEFNNSKYEFRYSIDYSKEPIWLDLQYTREGKPFQARLIVRFADENHLQWFTFFNEVRPAAFPEVDKGNVMNLTRVSALNKIKAAAM